MFKKKITKKFKTYNPINPIQTKPITDEFD